jgi:hypothetical protein
VVIERGTGILPVFIERGTGILPVFIEFYAPHRIITAYFMIASVGRV